MTAEHNKTREPISFEMQITHPSIFVTYRSRGARYISIVCAAGLEAIMTSFFLSATRSVASGCDPVES